MERIRDHPDFNHFFVEYPGDTTWMEANLFDGDTTGDNRIPFDVLSLPAAEVVFKNIVNQLHAHNHQLEWVVVHFLILAREKAPPKEPSPILTSRFFFPPSL